MENKLIMNFWRPHWNCLSGWAPCQNYRYTIITVIITIITDIITIIILISVVILYVVSFLFLHF